MIVRELITKLGFKTDTAGFQKAEKQFDKLKGKARRTDAGLTNVKKSFLGVEKASFGAAGGLSTVVGILAGSALLGGFQALQRKASDANEDMNVLMEVFGPDGVSRIKNWGKTVGDEMGRSEYAMRNSAAGFGAFLEKMTPTIEEAETMSTTFAQLAVDMGSFYNTSDKQALTALKAGIVGETEPLKRYGIVMLESSLKAFALEKGIRKSYTAMDLHEKTALRFQFIMANTTKAQGDAARTSKGYANATKALKAVFNDIAVAIGMAMLPKVEKAVNLAKAGARRFLEWTRGSNILKNALTVLTVITAALTAKALIPLIANNWKLILQYGAIAAAVGAAIIVFDDLHTMFEGGVSVTGAYLDNVFGLGTTDSFVRNHAAGVQILGETWDATRESVGQFASDTWTMLSELFTKLRASAKDVLPDWMVKLIGRGVSGISGAARSAVEATGLDVGAMVQSYNAAPVRRAKGHGLNAEVEALEFGVANIDGRTEGQVARRNARAEAARLKKLTQGSQGGSASVDRYRSAQQSITVGGTVINVGNAKAEDVPKITRKLRKEGDRQRRQTQAALTRSGGG